MKTASITTEALPANARRALAEGRAVSVKAGGKKIAMISPVPRKVSKTEITRQCRLLNERDAEDGDFWERVAVWP